ncbi:MAG: bifunctional riboflavin kinase/FAD synthetase [Oscillospiraceae bacterium]|nr:bifunctional riboflavin kinase/FAD synthetase [Oscillospiraceae bacterium]
MKILKTLDAHPLPPRSTSVAIGCFDGVHLAHRQILERVIRDKQTGLSPAVFTFDQNPDDGGKGMPLLMTTEEKLSLFAELGIEVVFLMQFQSVREMSPEDFVRTVLKTQCGAKNVCCGYNFHFGKGGSGSAETLRQLCRAEKMNVTVLSELDLLEAPVSSTRIRGLIQSGDLDTANVLLGRPFSFKAPVVHGRKLGRTIGVPTMNQPLAAGCIHPKNGVYVSSVLLDGKRYGSVTNIGIKPTVGGEQVAASETWISGFSGDLYGKTVRVFLHHYLRQEQKFPTLDVLRDQIQKDQQAALQWQRDHL